jgi:glucose-6-phosphate 1-epimerase
MNDESQIEFLNRRCGIPGVVQVSVGNGGLAKLRIATAFSSSEIYLHGAQVTSWQPAGGEEAIFLSEHSQWQDGRAIRGGIPICFPWFRAKADDPQAPSHGFVRIRQWQLDSVTVEQDGSVVVVCATESDESTRRWWPHGFRLMYRVTIGRELQLELTAINTESTSFRFEEALHTYFRVGNAQSVRVHGLDQAAYFDNADGNREKVQSGDILFAAATDNAYINTKGAVDLIDPAWCRTIRTEKENSGTTVVWNPWQQGAASLSDFGNDEWQRMTCVEACNILGSAVLLGPGQSHTMRATLGIAPG